MTRYAFTLLLLILSFTSTAQVLRFYAESLPPYHYTDDKGQPTGALVEIIKAVAKQANVHADIRLYPFARGYQLMLTDKNSFMFSLLRTPQRETKLRWIGQIYRTDAWLIGLRGRQKLNVTSLEQVKKLTIGTIRGYHSEKFLKSHGFVENRNLFLSVNYRYMWNMLFRKRIDFILTNTVSLNTELKSLGFDVAGVEKYFEVKHFPGELFLVTNLDTPTETVQLLSQALNVVKENGEYRKIIDKWGL